jgi:hypothetical protein
MRAGGDGQRGWEELGPREGQDSMSRETRERVEERYRAEFISREVAGEEDEWKK